MGMCRDVGMHQRGVGAKCSHGACAPAAPSQPRHWGGHEMIVPLFQLGCGCCRAPRALSGAEILTELMGGSGALCRPSQALAVLSWLFLWRKQ